MSITQVSNNRPAGSTAKSCDAGIPIVGRTSATGVYEILKVNSDGSLPLAANGTAVSGVPTASSPSYTANPVTGIKPAKLILAYTQLTPAPITAGMYRINPFFRADLAAAGGSVSFVLIKAGTSLDVYTSSQVPFADAYNPLNNDFLTGYSFFWHNIAMQVVGGTVAVSYNVNTEKTLYLEAGQYWLLTQVDTAINMTAGAVAVGTYEFTAL